MSVRMMRVGHVRMRVRQRLVHMRMAVGADRNLALVVLVAVMSVVMPVGVFMRQGFMDMGMAVTLHQVQQHASQHQHAAPHHPGAG